MVLGASLAMRVREGRRVGPAWRSSLLEPDNRAFKVRVRPVPAFRMATFETVGPPLKQSADAFGET
ncbi:hypothetical protein Acsp07_13180 [Actinomycetospora sp. NBRC 106378]|nr:hypothetical protein Acsp07_13180 [Actinomycetospora sp. NBRC 106378]